MPGFQSNLCTLVAFLPSMVMANQVTTLMLLEGAGQKNGNGNEFPRDDFAFYADWELAVFLVIVIFVNLTILISLCCLCKSMMVVHHSEVVIKERCGKYTATLKPGFHWLWPYIDHPRIVNWRFLNAKNNSATATVQSIVTDHIDTREHVIDFGRQTVSMRVSFA